MKHYKNHDSYRNTSIISMPPPHISYVNVRFSILPLKIILFLLVAGPLYGAYVSYSQQKALIGLIADQNLLLNYSVYSLLFSVFLYKIKSNLTIKIQVYDKRTLKKISLRILFLAVLAFVSIFLFAGIHTLTGNLGRGEVRVNAGILGPIYALSLKYLLPTISLIASIILYDQKRYRLALACYIILIASGFMTGAKAITVFILLSTACYFWPKITLLKKLSAILFAIIIMASSHSFFTQREITFSDSLNYNFVRGTEIAAYGLLASWEYNKNFEIDKIPVISRSIFGDNITKLLFNSENNDSIDWDIAKLITYHYYPSWEKALDGTTNLTRTIFSDFILFFGSYWILGFSAFLLYLSLVFDFMHRHFLNGNIVLGSLAFIYLNMTIIPMINSGGIFSIISTPIIIYYTILFFALKFYIFR